MTKPERSSKLIADIRADLERFRAGEPTLDVENILDLITENERLRAALDALALALTEHHHVWTTAERALYDHATR